MNYNWKQKCLLQPQPNLVFGQLFYHLKYLTARAKPVNESISSSVTALHWPCSPVCGISIRCPFNAVGERIVFFGFMLALVEESSLSWHCVFKSKLSRMLKHLLNHVTPLFIRKPVLYRAHGVNRLLPACRELVKTGVQVGTCQPGHSSPPPKQDADLVWGEHPWWDPAWALVRVMAVVAAKYFAGEW